MSFLAQLLGLFMFQSALCCLAMSSSAAVSRGRIEIQASGRSLGPDSKTAFHAGGGLISGIALAAKSIKPSIKIFAAEPKGADDAAQSKAAGRLITLSHTNTIADGLRAWLGTLTWPIVQDMVDEVITVEEDEIVAAMRMCYERLKVVVEPSGAVGLAAALSERFQCEATRPNCEHVGIVLSGGNVDLGFLCELFQNF